MVLETSPILSTLYRPPAAAALPPDHDPFLRPPAFRQDLPSQAPSCIASGSTVSGPLHCIIRVPLLRPPALLQDLHTNGRVLRPSVCLCRMQRTLPGGYTAVHGLLTLRYPDVPLFLPGNSSSRPPRSLLSPPAQRQGLSSHQLSSSRLLGLPAGSPGFV